MERVVAGARQPELTAMPATRCSRCRSREMRRSAILAIARDAFLERGYAATAMSTIAARVGGSKGTLWAYFRSKEALFAAVLDDATDGFLREIGDALDCGHDVRTTLLHFSERFLLTLLKPDTIKLYRLIIGESGRIPEVGRSFYAHGPQLLLEQLVDYIRERMKRGDLRQDDAGLAAHSLVQLVQTQQNLRLCGGGEIRTVENVRTSAANAVDLFMRAYAP